MPPACLMPAGIDRQARIDTLYPRQAVVLFPYDGPIVPQFWFLKIQGFNPLYIVELAKTKPQDMVEFMVKIAVRANLFQKPYQMTRWRPTDAVF